MLKSERLVSVIFVISILLGAFIGWELSFFRNFQYFKLVNLTGLLYDMLAILLLSYAVLANDSIKDHVAHKVSMFVIILSSVFPMGIVGGSALSSLFGGGVSGELVTYIYSFVGVSIIPTYYFFGSPVFEPVGNRAFKPEKRIKILGAILLFMGFVFQIIAAFGDLLASA